MFLKIDLNAGRVRKYTFDKKILKEFIGGEALATYYLYYNLKKGINPLSRNNQLLFFTGPLVGTSCQGSGKCGVYTKSPLTNYWCASYMGGMFGAYLRRAGITGLIITGKSRQPANLVIKDGKVELIISKKLWGKDTNDTTDYLKKKYKGCSVACIGQAGENKTLCASIITNKHRAAARYGVGAVMGSKNLKAVIIMPMNKLKLFDEENFNKTSDNFRKLTQKSTILSKELPEHGTPFFLDKVNKHNALPVKNFTLTHDEDSIKSKDLDKYAEKSYSCFACTAKCDKRAVIDGKEYGIPEYESTGLLGSNLLNHDTITLIKANDLCDKLGMDTIDVGNLLGAAMESGRIKWGDKKAILDTIKKIAYREGIGETLSKGLIKTAEEWHAKNLIVHAKGAGFPSYNPFNAYGMGLHYATGNRGANHLTGYMALFECLGLPISASNNKSTHGRVELVKFLEDFLIMFDSMILCKFMPAAYTGLMPEPVFNFVQKIKVDLGLVALGLKIPVIYPAMDYLFSDLLKMLYYSTGNKYNMKSLVLLGEKVNNLQRLFNLREGLKSDEDNLSPKFKSINIPLMVKKYYKLRGWDENGVPTREKLKELKIKKII